MIYILSYIYNYCLKKKIYYISFIFFEQNFFMFKKKIMNNFQIFYNIKFLKLKLNSIYLFKILLK